MSRKRLEDLWAKCWEGRRKSFSWCPKNWALSNVARVEEAWCVNRFKVCIFSIWIRALKNPRTKNCTVFLWNLVSLLTSHFLIRYGWLGELSGLGLALQSKNYASAWHIGPISYIMGWSNIFCFLFWANILKTNEFIYLFIFLIKENKWVYSLYESSGQIF